MGRDIHGVWECKLPNGEWVVFKEINDSRNYTWFGIIARVQWLDAREERYSIPWDPRDFDGGTGAYWTGYCEAWGLDLHSHSRVSWDDVYAANAEHRRVMLLANPARRSRADGIDHETLPDLDDGVAEIWIGGHQDRGWRPNAIPMNIPLRDVLGLGPEATLDDLEIRSRIRMVVAFDN